MILVKSSADEPMLVMSGKLNDHKSVWIPYLQEIEKVKPNNWRFIYNGGEVTLSLSAVQTIMFYGNSGTLPVDFLLAAAKSKTAIIVHSRNQDTPMILSPVTQPGKPDVLTEQIRFRENHRKKMVIAKAMVSARIMQMDWLTPFAKESLPAIRQAVDLDELLIIEAMHTKRYWERFFAKAGMPEANRRDNNPVSEALDALSFFLSGLLMRWVVLHRMSPSHGYLHRTVDFNSLVYDLMEPIRHWSEQAVMAALLEKQDQSDLLPRSINVLKSMLAQNVEVPSLQIEANRKNILHGVVLAIRSYILGECDVLNFPLDGQERTKGRPVKAAYRVPGSRKRHR